MPERAQFIGSHLPRVASDPCRFFRFCWLLGDPRAARSVVARAAIANLVTDSSEPFAVGAGGRDLEHEAIPDAERASGHEGGWARSCEARANSAARAPISSRSTGRARCTAPPPCRR